MVARLQALVEEKALADKVELASKFCMAIGANGVCVSIDDENFEHIGRTTWIPSSKTK